MREVVNAQAHKLSTAWSPNFVTILSQPKIVTLSKPQTRHESFVEDLGGGVTLEMKNAKPSYTVSSPKSVRTAY
ncbi:MAG: hypothetical protein U0X75_26035 [Acidobacteriota bacterium]